MLDSQRRPLVTVAHYRCNEPAGQTVLWGPLGLTQDQFVADIAEAQDRVLRANAQLKEDGLERGRGRAFGPSVGGLPHGNFFAKHPEMTVEAVISLWEEQQQRELARFKIAAAACKSFAQHMLDLGYLSFWEKEADFVEATDWGHRHGSAIELGCGEIEESPSVEVVLGEPDYERRHL